MTLNLLELGRFKLETVKCRSLLQLSYYLNVKDPLIIPLIIFSSCCEKVHDNKEFSHENSKPHRESQIMTGKVKP